MRTTASRTICPTLKFEVGQRVRRHIAILDVSFGLLTLEAHTPAFLEEIRDGISEALHNDGSQMSSVSRLMSSIQGFSPAW
jgi:hypothetical protein